MIHTDDTAGLSGTDKMEYYEELVATIHKLGRQRLKKGCPRPRNLALSVAVRALKEEATKVRADFVSRLDRS